MDPRFAPGRDGVQSCLKRMGLAPIAEYADLHLNYTMRGRTRKTTQTHNHLAFWGVYSAVDTNISNTSVLEDVLVKDLRQLIGVEVIPIQPLSKDSEKRPSLISARYNLIAIIYNEADQVRLALHLIERLDVEMAADLDLIIETEPQGFSYRSNEIVLGEEGFVDYLESEAGEQLMADLLFGGVEPVTAEYLTRPWLDERVASGEFPKDDLSAFLGMLSQVPRSQKLLLEFDNWNTRNVNTRGWLHGMAYYLFQSEASYEPEDFEFYTKLQGKASNNYTLGVWYRDQINEILQKHYPDNIQAITIRINDLIQHDLTPLTREQVAQQILIEITKIEQQIASGTVHLHDHSNQYPSSLSALRELMEYYAGTADTLNFHPLLPLRLRFAYYDGGRSLWLQMGSGPHRPTVNRFDDDLFSVDAAELDAQRLLEVLPIYYNETLTTIDRHGEQAFPWSGTLFHAPWPSKRKKAQEEQQREMLTFLKQYLPSDPDSLLLNQLIQDKAPGNATIGGILLKPLQPAFRQDPLAAYETHKHLLTSSLQFQNFYKNSIREEDSDDKSHSTTYRNNRDNYAELRNAVIAGLQQQLENDAYWDREFFRNESKLLRYFRVPWECIPQDYQQELIHLNGRASRLSHPSRYEEREQLIEYFLDQVDTGTATDLRRLQQKLTLQYVEEQSQGVWAYLAGVQAAWILEDWEGIQRFREFYHHALQAGELDTNRTHRVGFTQSEWLQARDSIAAYLDGISALAYAQAGQKETGIELLDQRLLNTPSADMSTVLHYLDLSIFPEDLKATNTREFLLQVYERIEGQ